MPDIVAILFPVFAVVAVGYAAAYTGVLSPRDTSGISRFVFIIAIPILLFESLSTLEFPDHFRWEFLFSFYLAAFLVYALGMILSRFWFGAGAKEQAIFGLGSAYSNMVLVGLPVISAAFGEQGLLPMFILISIHSLLLFTIFLILAERSQEGLHWLRGLLQSSRNLLQNPLIIGLLAGLLARFLNLQLPQPVGQALDIISQAALPCALIVLGASLRQFKIRGELTKAWTIIALKLIVQPLIVGLLVFYVFDLEPVWGAVAVVAAGLPVGVNSYIMAESYQVGRATISTAILLSTLLAIFTLSVLLSILL
ncbi:MAG: AEC family transporter [Anaerolineales bacterium]